MTRRKFILSSIVAGIGAAMGFKAKSESLSVTHASAYGSFVKIGPIPPMAKQCWDFGPQDPLEYADTYPIEKVAFAELPLIVSAEDHCATGFRVFLGGREVTKITNQVYLEPGWEVRKFGSKECHRGMGWVTMFPNLEDERTARGIKQDRFGKVTLVYRA